MKKKFLAAALAAAMVLAMPLTVSASWQKDNNGVWSWSDNGTKATGWKQVGGTWYYFNANGDMQTGWQSVNGKWYYMDNSGAMATGWRNVGGKWYHMSGSGAMSTGWVKSGDKWYHMSGSGAMSTGWVKSGDKWYYTDNSGVMQTGKVEIGGATYFLDASNGDMKTGFITEGDKTYFASENGVQTGVVEVNGETYYFDEEDGGAMATGSVTIDGKTYTFDEDGACTSRKKPVADVAFETTGDGSTTTPVTPGGSTGGSTGGGSTGGDTGSTGGSTGGSSSSLVDPVKVTTAANVADTATDYTVSNSGTTVTIKALKGIAKTTEDGVEKTWVKAEITVDAPVDEISVDGVKLSDKYTINTTANSFTYMVAVEDLDANLSTSFVLGADGYRDARITVQFEQIQSKVSIIELTNDIWSAIGTFGNPNPGQEYFAKTKTTVEGTTISVATVDGKELEWKEWEQFNTAVEEEQEGYYALVLLEGANIAPGTQAEITVGSHNGPKVVKASVGADGLAQVALFMLIPEDRTTTWTIDWDGAAGKVYAPVEYTVDYSKVKTVAKPEGGASGGIVEEENQE